MLRKSVPKRKTRKTAKDTPAKQYERFLETAEAIGASNDPKDLDKALKKVTKSPAP